MYVDTYKNTYTAMKTRDVVWVYIKLNKYDLTIVCISTHLIYETICDIKNK